MTTLYELADQYTELFRAVEECEDGEQLAYLLGQLNVAEGELVEKIDSIASIVANFERLSEAAGLEKKRLAAREIAFGSKADRIKAWLLNFLIESGRDKVVGDRFTVSTRKCPASVEVLDQTAIPDEFLRTKTTTEVDKSKILERWKLTSEAPEGVNVISNRKSLQIK